jgi:glycine/D-amino acid oxidase-like deaminating enzyme
MGEMRPALRHAPRRTAPPPVIAVVGPFSGPRTAWGDLLVRAVERHARPELQWRLLDDRGTVDGAYARAGEVVAGGGYAAVIGHFNSLGARTALPLYQAARLPVVLPLASAPDLLAGFGDCAVRWCPDDLGQAYAICRALRVRGHPVIAVRHDGTAYGRQLAARFGPVGAEVGVRVEGGTGPGDELDSGLPDRAVLLCGAHHTVAGLVHRLRAGGHRGLLVVTDDCQIAEFTAAVGAVVRPALAARLVGGPERLVDAAFGALSVALEADAGARGDRLLAAIRAGAGRELTRDGDPVDGRSGEGWEVVPVAAPSRPATSDGPARSVPTPSAAPAASARIWDAVVVGAGVVGAGVAARLAKAGVAVVVVDRGADRGATAFSGGLVRAFEPGPVRRALSVRSYQLAWGRTGDYPARLGLRRTGSLVLLGAEHLADAESGVRDLARAGITARLLPVAELDRRWPTIATDRLAGAVWEPGAGHANPAVLLQTLVGHAVRAGARVVTGQVRTLSAAGEVAVLDTDAGPLRARIAVLAAGCGTPALLAGRVSAAGRARTRRILYGLFEWADSHPPAIVDLVDGGWGRPDGERGYLAGFPSNEWDVPVEGGASIGAAELARIRLGVGRRLPWLTTAGLLGARFGTDLYAPDPAAGDAVLWGMVPGAPPTVAAAGWSGGGFKTAPAVAEQVAGWALDALYASGTLQRPADPGGDDRVDAGL